MTEDINARNADKFVVRLKLGMRDQLKARAKADNQTMNETAVTAVEKYLAQSAAFDALLAILEREVKLKAALDAEARAWARVAELEDKYEPGQHGEKS